MLSLPFLLAAGSLPTLITGLPVPHVLSSIVERITHNHFLEGRESATSYTVFGGSGTTADGWPAVSDWVSDFDTMFASNKGVMSSSCAQWGVADNSDDEIAEISTSIKSVASSTGVDPRFILAIVMQESNGCVRAPTTNFGVRNPGLMQTHNGAGTCNDATVSNPCPASEITQMITDGAAGTSSGDGLKQCIAGSGATDVSMYYKAARIYNSGSIAAGGNLGAGIATHCYSSDIANRLIGWATGPSQCNANTVGTLTSSGSFVSGGSSSGGSSSGGSSSGSSSAGSGSAPTTTSEAPVATTTHRPKTSATSSGGVFLQTGTSIAPQPTTEASTPTAAPVTATIVPVAATSTAAAASTPTPPAASSGSSSSSSAEIYSGAIASCQEYYTVEAGDYCDAVDEKFGITLSQLVSWNSGLDTACSNLWLGYQYCVKA